MESKSKTQSVSDQIKGFFHKKSYLHGTDLCRIMKLFGSDKGLGWHNYTTLYHVLFEKLRSSDSLNIFELGIGTSRPGASLFGWESYFCDVPNLKVFGADIDTKLLFRTKTIKTFNCDQTNPDLIVRLWNQEELKNIKFDIIVEDGLHEFSANLSFLMGSIHKLAPGGLYIVEDLKLDAFEDFASIKEELMKKYDVKIFELVDIPSSINHADNRLLIIGK